MRQVHVLAIGVLVLLGCAGQPAAAPPADHGSYRLYLRDYSAIGVAEAPSGKLLRTLPAGVPSPDWSRVYTVSGWTLRALDATTGQQLAEIPLPGAYELPFVSTPLAAVSPNGRWVAVSRWDYGSQAPGVGPSHFAVVDAERSAPLRQVDLRGFWTVDALSNDGRWLYLIEHLTGSGYRVRLYDLLAGVLNPAPVVDPSDGDKPMTGDRLDSIASPDGAWIYSLYASSGAAFIHALPVGSGSIRAVCIDLPDIKNRDSMTITMAPDGSRLYVTDGSAGLVREIIPPAAGRAARVARSLRLPPPATAFNPFFVDAQAAGPGDEGLGVGARAALNPSGLLYFPTNPGIGVVDVRSWQPKGRHLGRELLRNLTLSSDGRWLYAINQRNHLLRIDPSSGESAGELSGPWNGQLERAQLISARS
jgi:hypothetical protein